MNGLGRQRGSDFVVVVVVASTVVPVDEVDVELDSWVEAGAGSVVVVSAAVSAHAPRIPAKPNRSQSDMHLVTRGIFVGRVAYIPETLGSSLAWSFDVTNS